MTQPYEREYYCKLLLAFAYAEGFSQCWIVVLNDDMMKFDGSCKSTHQVHKALGVWHLVSTQELWLL